MRHTTHENYTGHVENYLKPFFGKLKVNQVRYEAIETFKRKALNGELPAECLKEKVAPSTLRNVLRTLHGIMKYAVKRRYIDHNPVAEVEKPKGKDERDETKEMRTLTLPEIKVFLEKAKDQRDRVLFMAAVLTGLREGELFGLQWGDIDWLNCQIHVRRTYNHGRFSEPKSRTSRRRVDLAPELVQELKSWKLACPKGEHDVVFPTLLGTPEGHSNMTKHRFKPTLRRAGIAEIRFHDLRHTYASLLIEQNEHPKYIQNQMGHSSITITMDTYGT
ncbi:MAG TPA: site-specific integrase [Syntrophobacteria bacterium]|nr:site-specific integrase [Syntrophobacteria bacterium]